MDANAVVSQSRRLLKRSAALMVRVRSVPVRVDNVTSPVPVPSVVVRRFFGLTKAWAKLQSLQMIGLPKGFHQLKLRLVTVAIAMSLSSFALPAVAQDQSFDEMIDLTPPTGPGAREPALATLPDGRVAISWTEPSDQGFAVRVVTGDRSGWDMPRTVAQGTDFFVNWADFPTLTALPDGTLAVQWLRINGDTDYAYDVNIALSSDGGQTWGDTLVPHGDGTQQQHGFVTLLPVADDQLRAIWLDGRNYGSSESVAVEDGAADTMQLRTATITSAGAMSDETLLDQRTCSCCQTSAVVADSGALLVVYRDRTEDEIRDIAIVRQVDGIWTEPAPVSADGWEISGCPVNGPAVDSNGGRAAVAWFTAANNVPQVSVAFSDDDGASFSPAIRIDQVAPTGQVDVIQRDDGSALVSWLEYTAIGEALMLCRVTLEAGCERAKVLTLSRTGRTMGFPRMTMAADGLYVAWTRSVAPSQMPENDTTIQMILIPLDDLP